MRAIGARTCSLAIALVALVSGAAAASARLSDAARGAHAPRTLDRTDTARAHASRSLDGTDTARLHLVRQDESVLYEEGFARGALPGRMRARLTVGTLFVGSCTIGTPHGSITGHGTAKPHGVGRYQSFQGTLLVTSGSGRYRGVHGRTQLYGTFDRRTFAVVVQTVGRLSY